MIYFSFGLPGPLTDWCDAVLAALAAREGHTIVKLAFSGASDSLSILDNIALALVRAGADHAIVSVRNPALDLIRTVRDEGAKVVLALDDPRVAAIDLAGGDVQGLVAAVRDMANAAPVLSRAMHFPGVLCVSSEDVLQAFQGVSAIAQHVGIAIDDAAARRIAATLDRGSLVLTWPNAMTDEQRKLVDGALGGYARLFSGGTLGDLIWMRALFSLTGNGAGAEEGIIALRDTANGRFLVYGPYLQLLPGYWSAKVAMGISPEACGQTFIVDAFDGRQLAVSRVLARTGGLFVAEIGFDVDGQAVGTVEIRVSIGRDVAPGRLAFGHVRLHPVAIQHDGGVSTTEGDFRAALAL